MIELPERAARDEPAESQSNQPGSSNSQWDT